MKEYRGNEIRYKARKRVTSFKGKIRNEYLERTHFDYTLNLRSIKNR